MLRVKTFLVVSVNQTIFQRILHSPSPSSFFRNSRDGKGIHGRRQRHFQKQSFENSQARWTNRLGSDALLALRSKVDNLTQHHQRPWRLFVQRIAVVEKTKPTPLVNVEEDVLMIAGSTVEPHWSDWNWWCRIPTDF